MKIATNIFHTLLILLMIGVVILFLMPSLPIENNLRLLIVESGSMEPGIPTGSLVLVYPQAAYSTGDVITFESSFGEVPTTHRVVDVQNENSRTIYTTKGDANEEADTAPVREGDVLGAVHFSVPYVGYILDFARQPLGFIFLIVLPALTFILGELMKIWTEIKRRPEGDTDTDGGEEVALSKKDARSSEQSVTQRQMMMDIGIPARTRTLPTLNLRTHVSLRHDITPLPRRRTQLASAVVAGFVAVALIGGMYVGATLAYPTDIESSLGNSLHAAELDITASADGTVFTIEEGFLVDDEDGAVIMTLSLQPGSLDVRYDIRVEFTGGDAQFCNQMVGQTNNPFVYDGPLLLLTGSDVSFIEPWKLNVYLGNNAGLSNGDVCLVDVVFTAWHNEEELDQGYFDEERVALSFTYTETIPVVPEALQLLSLPVTEEVQIIVEDTNETVEEVPQDEVEDEDEQGEDTKTEEESNETSEELNENEQEESEEVIEVEPEVVEEESEIVEEDILEEDPVVEESEDPSSV